MEPRFGLDVCVGGLRVQDVPPSLVNTSACVVLPQQQMFVEADEASQDSEAESDPQVQLQRIGPRARRGS